MTLATASQLDIQEIEISEVKHGFVPNSQDTTAWRVRRRYCLHKGGHPQLVLVHYTRGPAIRQFVLVYLDAAHPAISFSCWRCRNRTFLAQRTYTPVSLTSNQ